MTIGITSADIREAEARIKKMIEDRVQPLERRVQELERLLSSKPAPEEKPKKRSDPREAIMPPQPLGDPPRPPGPPLPPMNPDELTTG